MTQYRGSWWGAAIPASLLLACPAAAQTQTQPRDYAGVYGGAQAPQSESRHQLTLDLMFLGGHDDDVGRTEGVGSVPAARPPAQSSSFGEGSANLTYRHERRERNFQLNAYTNGRGFSALDYDLQVDGGGSAEFTTPLGHSTTLRGSHAVGYQTYYAVAPFSNLTTAFDPALFPTANTSYGLTSQRTLSNDTSLNLAHTWSRRHQTSVSGIWSNVQAESDAFFDFQLLGGTLAHSVSMTRRTALSTSYSFREAQYGGSPDAAGDVREQAIGLTLRTDRPLSPSRSLFLEAGASGSRIETDTGSSVYPGEYTQVGAHASAGTDLGRSWEFRGTYDRGWNMYPRLRQPLFSDSLGVSAAGFLGRRTDLILSGAYSRGTIGVDDSGRYETWVGSLQVRHALSRHSAIFGSYLYYNYYFSNSIALPAEVPPKFDRQVFRVGVTLWVPLAGSFSRGGGPR